MAVVHVLSRAILAHTAPPVRVEVDLSAGLPCFTLVGLADTEVKEARERVRAAIINSGLRFPFDRRITVNLAPAHLPKDSSHFDLPMALGILAASGQIPLLALQDYEFAGELSLNGHVQSFRGALVIALHLQQDIMNSDQSYGLVMPHNSAKEAAWSDLSPIWSVDTLAQVVQGLNTSPQQAQWQACSQAMSSPPLSIGLTIDDIKGQAFAKHGLALSAAGHHSLVMIGPPGCGKTLLAQSLLSLMPPMQKHEALSSASILSIAGQLQPQQIGQRPWQAPHHSISPTGLIGGGSPPKPGAISLAHHGILFLDELTEFKRHVLEQLREPLESGHIHLSKNRHHLCFPAQFLLISAMNPCPCGYLSHPQRHCRCTPEQIYRYRSRISGPWLDRIDIGIQLLPPSFEELEHPPSFHAASSAKNIQQARQLALDRQGKPNAYLDINELDQFATLTPQCQHLLQKVLDQQGSSARRLHRIRRLARTQADLHQHNSITLEDLACALSYQTQLEYDPLPHATH